MLIVYGGAFNPLTAAHQAAIRTLSQRFPDDALVALHATRLAQGAQGDLIVLATK